MSSFKRRSVKGNIKWIITFALISILIVGMIFAFAKIDKNEKTKTLGTSSFTYSIGILNAEGEYEQGTTSIYTKEFHSVDGLIVEVDEDATVKYSIFFFDKDEKYVDKVLDLSLNYDGTSIPSSAEYFKIMITPENDPEVSSFEIGRYARMITVTVNK